MMVSVAKDWRITRSISWGFDRIFALLSGVFHIFIMFFSTLFNPGMNDRDINHSWGYGSGSRPPSRRLGRPNTRSNVSVPYPGGCSSCAK